MMMDVAKKVHITFFSALEGSRLSFRKRELAESGIWLGSFKSYIKVVFH